MAFAMAVTANAECKQNFDYGWRFNIAHDGAAANVYAHLHPN